MAVWMEKNTLRSSPISLACFMGNVMRKTTGSRAIPATIPQVPHTSWQCWWNISIRDCSFDTFQYMFNLATDFFSKLPRQIEWRNLFSMFHSYFGVRNPAVGISVDPCLSPQIPCRPNVCCSWLPGLVMTFTLCHGSHGPNRHRW
jgi:hypothetical protein